MTAVVVVAVVAAAAPVEMESRCWKYAYQCSLLVIQIKCSILRKLIVHYHTYLQRFLLLSKCWVSMFFSLLVVILHM
jgi:hypothetical protein